MLYLSAPHNSLLNVQPLKQQTQKEIIHTSLFLQDIQFLVKPGMKTIEHLLGVFQALRLFQMVKNQLLAFKGHLAHCFALVEYTLESDVGARCQAVDQG